MQGKSLHNKSLIISTQKQPLNKEQEAFNKLIKQIEKLRADREKIKLLLDDQLDFYMYYLYPLEEETIFIRKDLVKGYYKIYTEQSTLTTNEKKSLKQLITVELEQRFEAEDNTDEDLKEMYQKVTGKSYDQIEQENFESLKDNMSKLFEAYGVNVDLSYMTKDMTAADISQKLFEMEEEMKLKEEAASARKKNAKKSTKQLEKEAKEQLMEEARKKNISTIYRQLAKMFHPDLEQDEKRKAEKEILMKSLTAAYERNDLHALLKLELEWIHKEEEHASELTDAKLAIYNTVLKEQVKELKEEINLLKEEPRYQPLTSYLEFYETDIAKVNLKGKTLELQNNVKHIRDCIKVLNGPYALREIRAILKVFNKSQQRTPNDDYDDWYLA